MRNRRSGTVRLASLGTLLLLALCASVAGTGVGQAATTPLARATSATDLPCDPITSYAGASFSDPTSVDNRFYPLTPGTKLVFEGSAEGIPHRVVFIVTDLTKVIDGVRTRIYWERDYSEGQLVETELAFRAQDDAGNVWHMGEYPETYEDGVFVEALPWIAGLEDAEPGTIMLGDPKTSKPKYLQGYAPEVEFLDCGKVYRTGRDVCVPAGCFTGVLVTNETSPPEPGSQRKFYAPGLGNIKVTDPNDPQGEFLELVEIKHLDADALEDARDGALNLEARAYNRSDAYAQTPPSEVWPAGGGSAQTFGPAQDTFVRANYPTENNGSAGTLRTFKDGSRETHSYLRFSVTGLSGPATSATLRFFVKDGSSAGAALYRVSDTSWSESVITWNTRPPLGSFITNFAAGPANTWVEIDVSSIVTGNGGFSFAATGLSTDAAWFSSKEGTDPPQLVVTS
jgi:hypothetical protein